MSNQPDCGEAVLEALRRLSVDYIIASPGSEWAPVWEALARQELGDGRGPDYIDCWHETLAVNMAMGYTLVTGRMQAVLLHAGSGLLQGSMGIHGAMMAEIPMVVMSGESLTYGEDPDVEPGAQWLRNLSIVGGPQALLAPIVKWSNQATSAGTIYEMVVRSGEMAQRDPQGPTYLNVPVETMAEQWSPPSFTRQAPPAPKTMSPPEDVKDVAEQLVASAHPLVATEAAGRDPEAFEALVELCDLLAVPVIESAGTVRANFPKDHPMYQGTDIAPFMADTDFALLVKNRAPWYPPGRRPPKARVVALDESPHRTHMVYQSLQADQYLEGHVASTLRQLSEEVGAIGVDSGLVGERRERLAATHEEREKQNRAKEQAAKDASPIDPLWLCGALRQVMPDDVVYVNEIVLHSGVVRDHVPWTRPQSYFGIGGGLGQGLGVALGVKLASPDRPVVALMGDGSFLYNPVVQSLGASRDSELPILIIVFNNGKYAAMQGMHLKMYPKGTAVDTDTFHGTFINAPDFVKVAESFGAYGERVEDPEAIEQALKNGLKAVNEGRSAIIDVVVG
ncbi:MAG: thiamine pyrophosphate-binding protein [Alphaproteobacteria bacterium]|nr:thiamine pyrophosphate-binding protein [Alphaproteobacteria bacterium]